jgi:hypothetical protein
MDISVKVCQVVDENISISPPCSFVITTPKKKLSGTIDQDGEIVIDKLELTSPE